MFTVFGASGLIGRALCKALLDAGEEVRMPDRSWHGVVGVNLGHVIYSIGDDRVDSAPFAVVDTHVSLLSKLLQRCRYDSFLYLSTTRVYGESRDTKETANVSVDLAQPVDFYRLTKLTGEALCLTLKNEKVRIARLSNVSDVNPKSHLFLPTLIRHALEKHVIELSLTPDSAKDYILLDDVVSLLPRIARAGTQRLYNVASGQNISVGQIVEILQRVTGCRVRWHEGSADQRLKPIDIERISGEFSFCAKSLIKYLPSIIEATNQQLSASHPTISA
jgi:nucleoside-diphosphate-sugar epimerase